MTINERVSDLIHSEIADFFAGFGNPGEPDIQSGEAQRQLIARIDTVLQQCRAAAELACPKCGGTGMADSGGVQPWGAPIFIECDCHAAPQLPLPAPEKIAMQNFRTAMEGIGHIRRTLEETFGGLHGTHCEPDVLVECKVICDVICAAYHRTAPQVTSVPDEMTYEQAREITSKKSFLVDRDSPASLFASGYNACRMDVYLAAPVVQAEQLSGNTEQVSQPYTLPADYLQGHKDGCEWAARMAEANHPQTGDWLFDDPIELAKAIRKGPDMLPAPHKQDFREIPNSSTNNCRENADSSTKCWCHTCRPVTMTDMRFVVCPECGNKRCPHANDHRNPCTGSNEPGQEGSAYPDAPKQEAE
ncbi:hypothetical protein [Atlantibacter hermannii]|uniref:hypothetical protein n=1 Tax=Atlantibacter hermannii TaxID=565 RepID=UPI0028A798E6|nr:hypothetical protein [Atlantibacter hermannii]